MHEEVKRRSWTSLYGASPAVIREIRSRKEHRNVFTRQHLARPECLFVSSDKTNPCKRTVEEVWGISIRHRSIEEHAAQRPVLSW